MEEAKIVNLYDLTHTQAAPLLSQWEYPWEALSGIGDFILELGKTLSEEEYDRPSENVWIAKSAKVYPNTCIAGPAIIGPRTEVRPGAFIRGKALVGADCVVGNSTELKNVILFDNVQVPHYNYVGDSILGYKSHMGAGSITSNVKSDKTLVVVRDGDFVEVGCGSVLNPGTVIGRHSNVYPLSMVRGLVPAGHIFKRPGEIAAKV